MFKADTLRIREITESDVEAAIDLLLKGFPKPRHYWEAGFKQLRKRSVPPGRPRYGFMLVTADRPVGIIIVIWSLRQRGHGHILSCNLSSWFVEADFRSYAPLLHKRALTDEGVTYVNLSAAAHTYSTIEALGFSRYSEGQVKAVLGLARNRLCGRVEVFSADRLARCALAEEERRQLLTQAGYGCIVFCCSASGSLRPFVFVPRLIRGFIPCAQLAYCRSIDELIDVAGTVGRYLFRLGRPLVLIDINGPIRAIPGKYVPGAAPKYYKGELPSPYDITETEFTIFGY
jgi:hypothetical protein